MKFGTIIYFRLFALGGSTKWYGKDWSSKVFERIDGEWIEIQEMKNPGKVYYIGTQTVELYTTDGILMDSNKTILMGEKCMRLLTPTFPESSNSKNYVSININFPEESCWNVSMKIMKHFKANGDFFVNVDKVTKNYSIIYLGNFFGNGTSQSNIIEFIQVQSGESLRIQYQIYTNINQGLILKICKEECCYDTGNDGNWLGWGQWTQKDSCLNNILLSRSLETRKRNCKSNCECGNEDINIKTVTLDKGIHPSNSLSNNNILQGVTIIQLSLMLGHPVF